MRLSGTSSREARDTARSVRDASVARGSALFDETLPFPPPPHRALGAQVSARAVATERGRSTAEARGLSLEQQTEAALARSGVERPAAELPGPASETPVQAPIVRAPVHEAPLGRLHWRGRELSPEFHEYALRVSRGEQLAPFRGRLLADDSLALPWEVQPWESADSRPLRSKAPRVVGLLLLGLLLLAVVGGSFTGHEPVPAFSEPLSKPQPVAAVAAPPAPAAPAASTEYEERRPPPVAEIAPRPVPVPSPPPVRQAQPEKKSAAPAAAPALPSKSALLVEEPPF